MLFMRRPLKPAAVHNSFARKESQSTENRQEKLLFL